MSELLFRTFYLFFLNFKTGRCVALILISLCMTSICDAPYL